MRNFDLQSILPQYGQPVRSVSGKEFRLYDFSSLSPNNPMYNYNPVADIGLGGKIGTAFGDNSSIIQAVQNAWSQAMQWENSQVSETSTAEVQANNALGINSDLTGYTAQGQSATANPQLETGQMPTSSQGWIDLMTQIPTYMSTAIGFISNAIGIYNNKLSSDIGLFNSLGGYSGLKERSVKNLQAAADAQLEGLTPQEIASMPVESIIQTAIKSDKGKRLVDAFRTKGFKDAFSAVRQEYGSSEDFAKYVRALQISKSQDESNPMLNATNESVKLWRHYNELLLTCQKLADIRSLKTQYRRDMFESLGYEPNGEFDLRRSASISQSQLAKMQNDAYIGALGMTDNKHGTGESLLQGSIYNEMLGRSVGTETNYYNFKTELHKAKTQYKVFTETLQRYQNSPSTLMQTVGNLNSIFFYQVTPFLFQSGGLDLLFRK